MSPARRGSRRRRGRPSRTLRGRSCRRRPAGSRPRRFPDASITARARISCSWPLVVRTRRTNGAASRPSVRSLSTPRRLTLSTRVPAGETVRSSGARRAARDTPQRAAVRSAGGLAPASSSLTSSAWRPRPRRRCSATGKHTHVGPLAHGRTNLGPGLQDDGDLAAAHQVGGRRQPDWAGTDDGNWKRFGRHGLVVSSLHCRQSSFDDSSRQGTRRPTRARSRRSASGLTQYRTFRPHRPADDRPASLSTLMCCIVVECARINLREVGADGLTLLEQVPDDRRADRVAQGAGQAGELLIGRRDRQAPGRQPRRTRRGSRRADRCPERRAAASTSRNMATYEAPVKGEFIAGAGLRERFRADEGWGTRHVRFAGGAAAMAGADEQSPARSAGRSQTNASAPRSRATVTWPNTTPHPNTLAPPKRSSVAPSASGPRKPAGAYPSVEWHGERRPSPPGSGAACAPRGQRRRVRPDQDRVQQHERGRCRVRQRRAEADQGGQRAGAEHGAED